MDNSRLHKFLVFPLALILALLSGRPDAAERREMVLGTAAAPPLSPHEGRDGYLLALYKEAFGRLGFGVTIIDLPGERALDNANQGIEDGDALRIDGLEKHYANLIKVPEPVFTFEFYAYTAGPELAATSWTALEPYSVALVTGWKFYENNLTPKTQAVKVARAELLFPLLQSKRADVALLDRWQAQWMARKQDIAVKRIEPPFARMPMFLYLNRRHAELAPKLADTLRQLKTEGLIDRVRASELEIYEAR